MKQCPKCGQFFDDSASFCSVCGAAPGGGSSQDVNFTPESIPYSGQPGPRKAATKQEFLKLPENKKMQKEILTAAGFSYVCAAMTAIGMIVAVLMGMQGNLAAIIDVLLLVGLGLGIQLKQSRVCAILLFADGAISVLASILAAQTPSGYLIVIASIFAIVNTFKLDHAWKQYQTGA